MPKQVVGVWCIICGKGVAESVSVEVAGQTEPFHLRVACDTCYPLLIKDTLADPAMRRK